MSKHVDYNKLDKLHESWLRKYTNTSYDKTYKKKKAGNKPADFKRVMNLENTKPWKGSIVHYDGNYKILTHPSGAVAEILVCVFGQPSVCVFGKTG